MLHLSIKNVEYQIDVESPLDISIPLKAGLDNPNCYGSEPPSAEIIKSETFIGSVAEGGPCNHNRWSFSPHGNGTHTECYGHISQDPSVSINKCLNRFHFITQLVSVETTLELEDHQVIRWDHLKTKLAAETPEALVIRTLPNPPDKTKRQYTDSNPPYLEVEAAEQLAKLGVVHLLVDLPSVDPEIDNGELAAHHAFWNYPDDPRFHSTITELVYVPDSIEDGIYLLNLQVISLESDASPSKPILYPIVNYSK